MGTKEVAEKLGGLLDGDDFDAAAGLLAHHCTYDTGDTVLTGPREILEHYSERSAWARARFQLEYSCRVVESDGAVAVIEYTDRATRDGQTHVYRCNQRIEVDSGGRVTSIQHRDLPGEREKLEAFFATVGVDLRTSPDAHMLIGETSSLVYGRFLHDQLPWFGGSREECAESPACPAIGPRCSR